jgi:hypothetical protein
MRRTVFLPAASLVCALAVNAQQHGIDTQKSTLTIHVGKTGVFSGLGHEHEVRAPIHSGTADTGSHPSVEVHVDARELRVIGKDEPEKDRAEVQKTMLGPEVLAMARLTLARKIAAITLIAWKKGASFDAKYLKQAA